MNKKIIATVLCMTILAPAVVLATDGNAGTTSTGSSVVTVTIPELIKITSVDPLTQSYNGTTAFDQNDSVCIYSNMDTGGGGTYSVTATGSYTHSGGTVAGFRVANSGLPVGDTVIYTVEWNDTNSVGGSSISSGSVSPGHTGWSNSPNCGGSTNANFRVQMSNAALLAVHPATYTSTLSLVVAPVP